MGQSPAPPAADGLTLDLPAGRPERMGRVREQLEHLFGGCQFPVHLGLDEPPMGFRVVDSWRVIPNATDMRFLTPLDATGARTSVTSHNGLRSPKAAAVRTMAGLSIGPMIRTGQTKILQLSVPTSISEQDVTSQILTAQLRHVVPGAHASAISLRDFHPRAKPTLQLLDSDGQLIGFAKAARDTATAQRVLREAELLTAMGEALRRDSRPQVHVPQVLHTGRCGPFAYSVVAPLPQSARRAQHGDEPVITQLSKQLCLSAQLPPAPLSHTTLWQETYQNIQQLPQNFEDSGLDELAHSLRNLATATAQEHAETTVTQGFFHGDWVPWNMGWVNADHDRQLWVWDLEYGSAGAPLGLDALRWEFQIRHVQDRCAFGEAVAAMAECAPSVLERLGIDPALSTPLIRLHLLENITTALLLAAGGRGMPPGLTGAEMVIRQQLSD